MKKPKRLLCLFLALACLVFAACGPAGGGSSGGDGTSTPSLETGRYIETDVTPPHAEGEMPTCFTMPDGSLVCYTMGLGTKYTSTDGGQTWEQTPGPGDGKEDFAGVYSFAPMADGTILAAISVDGNYGNQELVRIHPDGTTEPFAVEKFDQMKRDGKMPAISRLAVYGELVLLDFYDVTGMMMGMDMGNDAAEGEPPAGEDASGAGDALVQGGPATAGPSGDGPEAGGNGEEGSGDDDGGGEEGGMRFSGGGGESVCGLFSAKTGELVANLMDAQGYSNIMALAANSTTLYILDFNGGITARSLADGSVVQTPYDAGLPVEQLAINYTMAADDDGNLYLMDGKKVTRFAGETSEALLDSSGYSFGTPGWQAGMLQKLADGSLLALMLNYQNGSSKLYRYTWDENATIDPEKVITVWSLEDNSTLRASISAFRQKNPDATVVYEIGTEGGVPPQDAIKNLNTRLLGGDGPDLMLLDGCPAESYAGQGMLMDLTNLVDTADVYGNLLDAFAGEGGTYLLPTRYSLPMVLSEGGAPASFEELVQAVQNGPATEAADPESGMDAAFNALAPEDRPALAFEDLREAFDALWAANSPAVVKDGQLDSEALTTFLQALHTISERYGIADSMPRMGAMAFASSGDSAVSVIEGSLMGYYISRANYALLTVKDLFTVQMATMDRPGTEAALSPGMEDGVWNPAAIAAVNADTERAELCGALLNEMLSPEVQAMRGDGLPVTKAGYANLQAGIATTMESFVEQNEHIKPSDPVDIEPLVETLKTPALADLTVTETIWDGAEEYCKGSQTLEEAVSKIEQAMRNYLAERQS